jgi:CBS domain-containing protein
MDISDVLAIKGHRVETIWPTQPVRQIPKTFVDRNLTSVVVVSAQGRPIGIITDRHLLTAMAHSDGDLARLTAREVMTSPAPVCSPSDGVVDMLNRMTDERIRHIVVMDGDRMVGLVSIGDLVKHRLRDTDLEMRILRDMAFAHMAA